MTRAFARWQPPRRTMERYCVCTHHQDAHRAGGVCEATAATGGYCDCHGFVSHVAAYRPAYVPHGGAR